MQQLSLDPSLPLAGRHIWDQSPAALPRETPASTAREHQTNQPGLLNFVLGSHSFKTHWTNSNRKQGGEGSEGPMQAAKQTCFFIFSSSWAFRYLLHSFSCEVTLWLKALHWESNWQQLLKHLSRGKITGFLSKSTLSLSIKEKTSKNRSLEGAAQTPHAVLLLSSHHSTLVAH